MFKDRTWKARGTSWQPASQVGALMLVAIILMALRPAYPSDATIRFANQYPSLQAAHDSLPESGGVIVVPCGTFGPLQITKSNVRLTGLGECSIITAAASGVSNIVEVTNGVRNVVITHVDFQGQATDQSTIQRCVYLTGNSVGTQIERVIFGGTNRSDGCNIQVHIDPTSSKNRVSMNVLEQVVGTSSGGGYGILVEGSQGNIIANNLSIQTATQGRHHVYLSAGASSNIVRHNHLIGGSSDQIVLYALDSQPPDQYNVVYGNLLEDMTIGLGALGAIYLAQNVMFNKISGNYIMHAAAAGICVEASDASGASHANNNEIENNAIYYAGQFGILILGSSETMVRGNTVYEASQLGRGTYPGIGITSDSVNAQATDNSILDNGRSGPD